MFWFKRLSVLWSLAASDRTESGHAQVTSRQFSGGQKQIRVEILVVQFRIQVVYEISY